MVDRLASADQHTLRLLPSVDSGKTVAPPELAHSARPRRVAAPLTDAVIVVRLSSDWPDFSIGFIYYVNNKLLSFYLISPCERPVGPVEDGRVHPITLPAELAAFLESEELTALFHASDTGTLVVVKQPSHDLTTLRGPLPIGLVHELSDRPRLSKRLRNATISPDRRDFDRTKADGTEVTR